MKTPQRIASLACLLMGLFPVGSYGICTSPQYAEIGQQGTLECDFPAAFSAIIWYDSEDTTNSQVARIERQADGSLRISEDSAEGGIYRITSNGSLIIPFVSKQHDRNFTVFIVDENSAVSVLVIQLITVVYPHQDAPLVNSCGGHSPCLLHVVNGTLSCTYSHARPAVILSWYHYQSSEGNLEPLPATLQRFSEDGVTFSSVLTIHIANMTSNVLSVFTCQAVGPAVKGQNEAYVLVTNALEERCVSCGNEILKRNVKLGTLLEMPCIDEGIPYAYVWHLEQHNRSKTLVFSVKNKANFLHDINIALDVSKNGALIIPRVNFNVTGIYTCFSVGDGITSAYSVEIAVQDNESPEAVPVIIVVSVTVVTVLIGCLCIFVVFLRRRRPRPPRPSKERFEEPDDKPEIRPLQHVKPTTPIELCQTFAENLLAWPFIFENDPYIFHKNAINVLRDVSRELDEARREKDRAEATGAAVGLGAGAVTLFGVILTLTTGGGGALLLGAGTLLGVSGAAISVGGTLEKLRKDKEQIKIVQPSYQRFINIQKWLSKITINIATAHEIITFCREKQIDTSRNITVEEMESILEDMSVVQNRKDITVEAKIKNVMEYSKKLANILLRVLETYPANTASNLSVWKRNFQKKEGFKSDAVSEAVVKLLQDNQSEHETFTFLAFVKSLYATDFQSVDGIGTTNQEGNIDLGRVTTATVQAMLRSNLADDAARIGLNATRLARGVAVAGVVLNIVGMGMDAAALEKTLNDIESDRKEELSQCLTDTADVMEEMNCLVKAGKVQ